MTANNYNCRLRGLPWDSSVDHDEADDDSNYDDDYNDDSCDVGVPHDDGE